ncbi:tetratricopeptide repeat protein, partial [uncultured Salegentibacter sp.]
KIDLRVDDHENPIEELERLLKTARAYEFMNRGDLAMEEGNVEKALEEYGTAESMFPNNLEMRFWKAVALANSDRLQEAKQIFDRIFDEDENWRIMLKRLPKAGLINVSKEEMKMLTK